MQGFSQGAYETHQGGFSFLDEDDFICTSLPPAAFNLGSLVQMSTISEYDLGGEGDLFKAPEPILGEPVLALDPLITAAMSMMSGAGSIINPEAIEVLADVASIENEDPLSEMFYECKKDLIAKSAISESPPEEALEVNFDAVQDQIVSGVDESRVVVEGPLQKSVSFGCLSTVYMNLASSNFLDLHELDLELEKALCIRRVCSEGDIQNFGNNSSIFGNTNISPCSLKLLLDLEGTKISDKMEERRQKIYRYRKKRTKRNFGRKIKYACRKALADSQPRVRGRFARTEDKSLKMEEAMK